MRRFAAVLLLVFFGGFTRSTIAYDVDQELTMTQYECNRKGGHLANDSLYIEHPNLLVVYFDLANPAIVYRHRNRTLRVPVDASRISRIQSVRLFPETLTNFIAVYGGPSTDGRSNINYVARFRPNGQPHELPHDFTRTTEEISYHIVWREFNFANMGSRSRPANGLYNAKDCGEVFGFDRSICQFGQVCRTRQFSTQNVAALCVYDAARNITEQIEMDVAWENAHGILQCNRFVSVKPVLEDSDKTSALAIFHEDKPTICFTHPKEWVDVYAIYLTYKQSDYACHDVSEVFPNTATFSWMSTVRLFWAKLCFFCWSRYNFFLYLAAAMMIVGCVLERIPV